MLELCSCGILTACAVAGVVRACFFWIVGLGRDDSSLTLDVCAFTTASACFALCCAEHWICWLFG